ncbi:hypothetical protein AAEX28_14375 [Lentisphaerota bacterium WC36G]|nr:hypothetical protein LJT99_01130 [Lentisphaerae bacterium WC36]
MFIFHVMLTIILYTIIYVFVFANDYNDYNDNEIKNHQGNNITYDNKSIDVKLTTKIKITKTIDGYEQIHITGKTNLPPETRIFAIIMRKGYFYHSDFYHIANDGTFRIKPFKYGLTTKHSKYLSFYKYFGRGEYKLRIGLVMEEIQSVGVQKIIGKDAINLKGSLIRNIDGWNELYYNKTFIIK